MKANELISMCDFVQWIKFEPPKTDEDHSNHFGYKFGAVCSYANFLSTPLNISMFVPAIKVGGKLEVLEMPIDYNDMQEYGSPHQIEQNDILHEQYQTALENVIFEGFEVRKIDVEFTYIINPIYNSIGLNLMFNNITGSIVTQGIEIIENLLMFEPTLTKYGLELSGLNR